MITKEILVGTKSELVEYFNKLTEYTREHLTKENILYSPNGIEKQLDDIITKGGMNMIFVLTKDNKKITSIPEVTLKLEEFYVHIKNTNI